MVLLHSIELFFSSILLFPSLLATELFVTSIKSVGISTCCFSFSSKYEKVPVIFFLPIDASLTFILYLSVTTSSEGIKYHIKRASLLEKVNEEPALLTSEGVKPSAFSKFNFNLAGPEKSPLLIFMVISVDSPG